MSTDTATTAAGATQAGGASADAATASGDTTATTTGTTTTTATDTTATDVSGLREALDKERALRRDAERRAKDAAGYKTKLDELNAAQMTEQEKAVAKAVADAEARVKTDTLASTAIRLARAELRAAAGSRVEASALDGFLEYADLSKFVGENGEPDDKAIKAAIDKLAGPQRTNFDGGARRSAGATSDMNALIREKAFGR